MKRMDREIKERIVKMRYGMEIGYGQEIVRCKDCKNSGLDSSGINGYWCSAHTEWHDGDWFCADGVKKNA